MGKDQLLILTPEAVRMSLSLNQTARVSTAGSNEQRRRALQPISQASAAAGLALQQGLIGTPGDSRSDVVAAAAKRHGL
jgi:hypothetical protein